MAFAVIAVLLLVPALSGCNAMDSLTGKAKAGAPVDCSLYEADPNGKPQPLLLVLLDLSDNSADTAKRVSTTIRPYLDTALSDGEYVRLITSGGDGTGLTNSECFSGTKPFLVDRHNATREQKDRAAGGDALETEIDHTVQSTKIAQQGTATSLLAGIPDDVASLRATPNVQVGAVTVLVWSDLLGNGQDSDCLDVDGKKASVSIAEAVVKRCFSTNQLTEVKDAKIRFLGVTDGTGTKPQQDLARYLRAELCRRLSSDCA
jgi:hypothetical protein